MGVLAARNVAAGGDKAEIEGYLQRITQSVAPVTAAIHEGRSATTTSIRPQGRPDAQDYAAQQPNVTVESKFESNSKVDVNVAVSMPINIEREQKVDTRLDDWLRHHRARASAPSP